MKDQRGIALVVVLWGVTLLSLMSASLAASSGMAARRSLNSIQAAQARARLDEALAAAVLALMRPQRPWAPDGKPHLVALEGAEAEVTATDERGRADLNHAPAALLQSLFRRAAGSALTGDRLNAALASRVTARPLLTVAELASLSGMNAEIYRHIAPLVTVHNTTGRIDWRLADPELLEAIPGLDPPQISALIAKRAQTGYTPDAAMAEAMDRAGLGAGSDQGATGVDRLVSVHIAVNLASGGRASAEILVRLAAEGDPLHILEWRAPAGDS